MITSNIMTEGEGRTKVDSESLRLSGSFRRLAMVAFDWEVGIEYRPKPGAAFFSVFCLGTFSDDAALFLLFPSFRMTV